MNGASSSAQKLTYVPETEYGELNTAGIPRNVRMTGSSLAYTLTKEAADELNEDRAPTSLSTLDAEAGGDTQHVMSYAEYHEFLQATLQGEWTPIGSGGAVTSDLTVAATTITATVAVEALETLAPGQWFMLDVDPNSPNYHRLFRVHPTTPPTDTVITLDPFTPGAPETLTDASVRTSRLANGKVRRSYSLQVNYSDIGEFMTYVGQNAASLELALSTGAFATLNFTWMGKLGQRADTNPFSETPVDSYGFDTMSGASMSACAIWLDGEPLSGVDVSSLTWTYTNNLRARKALCVLGNASIGNGQIDSQIALSIYFVQGARFWQEMVDNENFEFVFTAFDMKGNGYVVTHPKASVLTYTVESGGSDSDVTVNVTLRGLLNAGALIPAGKRGVVFVDSIGEAVS